MLLHNQISITLEAVITNNKPMLLLNLLASVLKFLIKQQREQLQTAMQKLKPGFRYSESEKANWYENWLLVRVFI